MSITILLVDDHAILRDGLRAILQNEPDIEVIGEAASGRQALELVGKLSPDVIVMDVGMPDLNGVEATRQIVSADPKIRVIALSAYGEKQFVLAMLQAGAAGYMVKAEAGDELVRAIHAVNSGHRYLSSAVAGAVVDTCMRQMPGDSEGVCGVLSCREREILQLLAEGRTSKQIATRLHIAENTVEVHRRNIMQKLNLHNIAELTKYAVRQGITSP